MKKEKHLFVEDDIIAENDMKKKFGDWRDLPDKDYKQCEVCGKFFIDVKKHLNKVHGFKNQKTI